MTEPEEAAGAAALRDLQWNWGSAYLITGVGEHWVALRRDDERTLAANGPDVLRELITEDYSARPVSRDIAPGAAS